MTTLESGQLVFYVFHFSSEGVTIRLTVELGSLICYASTTVPNPDESHYDWIIETDSYADAFLYWNATVTETLFVSIQGLNDSNSCEASVVTGDSSTKGK